MLKNLVLKSGNNTVDFFLYEYDAAW